MNNPENSRLSYSVTQQNDGLYDINIQMSKCTPNSAFEILKRVEVAISNLPPIVQPASSNPEQIDVQE